MDYVALTERFVKETLPEAEIVVMGGSTARGTRTATSDIDLLVIGDAIFPEGKSSVAGAWEFDGEVFEVFAYTHDAYADWALGSVEQFRPVIVHLLVEGREVRGGKALASLRETWRATLHEGPPVSAHQLAVRRYVITDLIDDLRDGTDPVERHVLAWAIFERVAELMLLDAHRWIGPGKYLPRRLRELSPIRSEQLTAPLLAGDLAEFADRAEAELVRAGGRVHAGFIR